MKQLYIDAIVGIGFPNQKALVNACAVGLAEFDGTQHNESWAWSRIRLGGVSEPILRLLYVTLRQAQGTPFKAAQTHVKPTNQPEQEHE